MVELPDGLEYLGKECFEKSGLESIKTPSTLKVIEELAFCECKNLRRVEFSEGLEKIGAAAFYESGIKQVKLPSSTRKIGAEAFALCKRFRSVQLNEGLETLSEKLGDNDEPQGDVFFASALESVVIPSTLEVLEERTFSLCKKLTSVVFAEGNRLREIRDSCFASTALKTFKAPQSLRKIESGAFNFCDSLKRVVLNEGLEAVGEDDEDFHYSVTGAFELSGIKEIVLPSTLVQLGKDTFKDCCFLKRVWVE